MIIITALTFFILTNNFINLIFKDLPKKNEI